VHKVANGIGRVWTKITQLGSRIFSINNVTATGELSASPGLTLVVDVDIFGTRRHWNLRVGSHKTIDVKGVGKEALADAKKIVTSVKAVQDDYLEISKEDDSTSLVQHSLADAFAAYLHARATLCNQDHAVGLEACLQSVSKESEESWLAEM